jgi:hypothetical protein
MAAIGKVVADIIIEHDGWHRRLDDCLLRVCLFELILQLSVREDRPCAI